MFLLFFALVNKYINYQIVAMQKDRFRIDSFWMVVLGDLMMRSLLQAAIVGVLGHWRPNKVTAQERVSRLLKDFRGVSGQLRDVEFMLSLAKRGYLRDKTLASAHLYFTLLENLNDILLNTSKVYIISDRMGLTKKLAQKYPNVVFENILIGKSAEQPLRDKPHFLWNVYSLLPDHMDGTLSLMGADSWAEIYRTWVKQRGGIAIDIGSGFDLLNGKRSRPIHMLDLTENREYAL
ncbi:hypothetical protein ACFL07_04100 [Pseudomonadota bacterium]